MNESLLCGASSSTLHCVSWLTCCRWMGRCGRDWTLWPVNSPKLPTRSCRYIRQPPLFFLILSSVTDHKVTNKRPQLQVIVDSMVSLCRELCPLSSSAAERLTPPLSSVSERVSIPRSAIRTALMERAAQDIHRALE